LAAAIAGDEHTRTAEVVAAKPALTRHCHRELARRTSEAVAARAELTWATFATGAAEAEVKPKSSPSPLVNLEHGSEPSCWTLGERGVGKESKQTIL
jgi:hypothetical protein